MITITAAVAIADSDVFALTGPAGKDWADWYSG